MKNKIKILEFGLWCEKSIFIGVKRNQSEVINRRSYVEKSILGRTYVFGEKGRKVRKEENKREAIDFHL